MMRCTKAYNDLLLGNAETRTYIGTVETIRSLGMKKPSVVCIVLCAGISASAAFARGGGMGSHHASVTGGAYGTSPTAPGTNSLGTALPSSGVGNGPTKGPLLGTNPAIDLEEAKVNKMIGSICRGC